MTDYLEEHLKEADALLEQVRQMERGASGLPWEYGREAERADEAKGSSEASSESKETEVSEQAKTVDDLKMQIDRMKKLVYDPEIGSEGQGEESEQIVNLSRENENSPPDAAGRPVEAETAPEELRTNEDKAAKNSSPLAARLEELDRAVSALAVETPERRAISPGFRSGVRVPDGYPGITGTAGQSQDEEGRSALPLAAPGEELNWAERADRVFRRDSRRYDGGFYLY